MYPMYWITVCFLIFVCEMIMNVWRQYADKIQRVEIYSYCMIIEALGG